MLFLTGLLAFGFPMMFINMNWDLANETNIFSALLNAGFFNNYLITLGEFDLYDWKDENIAELYIMTALFIAASFFSQILLLNMLIALMGDTFVKVLEKK